MLPPSHGNWKNPALTARQQPRQKAFAPVQQQSDAAEDDFQRRDRKVDYEHVHVVQAVFTDGLKEVIDNLVLIAQSQGIFIPPALCLHKNQPPIADKTNKNERLRVALWLFERMPPTQGDNEAINQLACVLEVVEISAQHHYFSAIRKNSHLIRDEKPLQLPRPYPEPCHGQPLLVSHAIKHIVLVKPCGSVQIQLAPITGMAVDYALIAKSPSNILLTKLGTGKKVFW